MVGTTGFHHVTLVTADASVAAGFYEGVLGLDSAAEGRAYAFSAPAGGRLVVEEDRAGRKGRWGVGGVHHVAMGVAGEDDLLKWKRRLVDAGVSVTGPYDRGYFTSIYFTDPDGQILEIATAGPGYLIDESAEELGRELRIPPERILRGHRDEAAIAALTWPEPVAGVTEAMRLDGIHHVSAISDDLERAEAWYPAALGVDLVKRTVNRDDAKTLHYFWGVRTPDGVAPHSGLTLFGWPSSNYYAREGTGQTRRVAYRAGSADELAAWDERLRSRDVDVTAIEQGRGPRTLAFRAPDGLPLALSVDED